MTGQLVEAATLGVFDLPSTFTTHAIAVGFEARARLKQEPTVGRWHIENANVHGLLFPKIVTVARG